MIRGGFLTSEEQQDLLARDGTVEHRLARRANALVLLDRGMSCEDVGQVLLIDDDTIRTWHRLFEEDGVDGLAGLRGSRLPVDPGAAGQAEGRRHLADPDGRSVDRTRVRGCLREPFRADCAVASSGTSQARGGSSTRPNSRPSSTPT